MNYPDGEQIWVGDKVKLWNGCYGLVLCSIATQEYSAEYPKEQWSYLKAGILINFDQAGLIHYPQVTDKIQLIAR